MIKVIELYSNSLIQKKCLRERWINESDISSIYEENKEKYKDLHRKKLMPDGLEFDNDYCLTKICMKDNKEIICLSPPEHIVEKINNKKRILHG